MPVKLNSTGGGSVTLDTPSTASNYTATFPANTGNVVTTGSSAVVTPAMLTQPLTAGTAQNSTSGTSIDFTGIPSWVKRITVMLNGVSTNGTSSTQMQLGTSGGFVTSGYSSNFGFISSSSTVAGTTAITTGLTIFGINANTDTISGVFTLCNLSGNIWAYSGIGCRTGNVGTAYVTATPQTLSSALTQIRITTVNGTDTFDAGSINILYE